MFLKFLSTFECFLDYYLLSILLYVAQGHPFCKGGYIYKFAKGNKQMNKWQEEKNGMDLYPEAFLS